MNRLSTATLILVFTLSYTNLSQAQDFGSTIGPKVAGSKSWDPFAKSGANEAGREPFSRPQFTFPKFQLPKLGLFGARNRTQSTPSNMDYSTDKPNAFHGIPNLFQRQSDEPNMFQTFNQRSAEFWNKKTADFSNWARETNATMKARTFETWDNITKGLNRNLPSLPQPKKPNMKFPPFRSAEKPPAGEPSVRF